MESRERVLRAIGFGRPDRPPISHAILPSAQYHYGEALKRITDAVSEDFGWSLLPDLPPENLPALYKEGEHRDDFGTLWKVSHQGRCGIPIEFPIDENWTNYTSYRWPVFEAGVPKCRLYSGHMSGNSPSYYARGGWITFFEQIQQLHGFEATLVDFTLDRKEIWELRDRLLEFNLSWIDRWLEHEYQGLHFADDWGSQTSLLISPAKWRSFFKPVYAAMFSKVKKADVHVWFHSDGNIIQILPDLLELGVDVLNCQASAIGLEKLKAFAGKVCFRTDLDRQHLLPFASPAEVKRHVHDLFDTLGTSEGGIVACGEIIEDVPLANVEAMYEAFLEYRY